MERFLKAEPTKEEKKKHEEIKETMSPVQQGAAEKLGEVFEDSGETDGLKLAKIIFQL